MRADDADLDLFLTAYAAACRAEGVEPLPVDYLAVLAEAMLTSIILVPQTSHSLFTENPRYLKVINRVSKN